MINQKHNKDCLQATLANGLGLDYKDIPQFFRIDDLKDLETAYEKWLHENGYFRILFDPVIKEGVPHVVHSSVKPQCIIGYLQKDPSSGIRHAVLMSRGDGYLRIEHDPLEGSSYGFADLFQMEYIYELEG